MAARAGIAAASRTAGPATTSTAGIDEREFTFTAADFARIRKLIRARAGISLGEAKHSMVYSRVSRRLRACGERRFADYLDRLEAAPDGAEWEAFTNALTTNLTSFFREPHHFPIFAQHLRARAGNRPMIVWCAAASTGEEPYSIAIAACEAFGTLSPPVRILASDIDTAVLDSAARAVYPLDRVAKIGSERLRKFFRRGCGANAGHARVRDEIRALVEFRQVNLLDAEWNVPRELVAIFCRNLLIYFDRATQAQVVARFAPMLAADGLLFAGHSESLSYASRDFHACGKTVYAKLACP